MKNYSLLITSIIWLLIWHPYNGKCQVTVDTKGYPDHIILNVTEDLTSTVAVNWRTDETQPTSKIQLATENSSANIGHDCKEFIALSEPLHYKGKSHYYHSFTLDGLAEGVMYVYRVGEGDKWSEWINFKTINSKSPTFKFLYFGDVQTNIKSLWSRVARQAVKTMPDAQVVLYAGDIVNRGNNLDEWEDWFTATANMHQSIPILAAAGNHDHGDDDAGNYGISAYWNKQFNLPLNGIDGLKETSYYIDINDVKFVVVNTELLEEYESIKQNQLKWLQAILSANTQKWTILVMHHPIYSTKKNRDNKELRELIKPLIDRYNVDLVLQGHDHTYARGKDKIPMEDNKISNATYVVTVSGPKLSEVLRADWMDKSYSFKQLFHAVEITDNELTFSAYKSSGELADKFVISKSNGINTIIE